ncbi:MAG: hypothetical protein ABEJ60_05085 [Halodesulfurarchaeum sp.]
MADETISANLRDRLEEHRDSGGKQSGTLVLSDEEGLVGETITIKGRNLPATESLEVVWHSVDGEWGVLKANELLNPQYRPRTDTILEVQTDESGSFTEEWQVQQDYGSEHKIEVRDESGTALASTTFVINPHFEIDRTSAEMGDRFHLTGYGLGPKRMTNNYPVTWDNRYIGFMTGVQNRGTANAEIRAVGPPGDHVIQLWESPEGMPYLQNYTTNPFGDPLGDQQSKWMVEVTEPSEPPATAEMDPLLDEEPLVAHLIDPDEETAATIDISPTSGQAGTDAIITGQDFPPETEVDLVWYTHAGHRFMDDPIKPTPRPSELPTVRTDESGSFQVDVTIPSDIGETRPIAAVIDGTSVATTGFMLQPEIVDMTPEEGPVGTTITIKIAGIGWALYDNNYSILYDNSMAGYVCSHNREDSDEDPSLVEFTLTASGEPGYHFIDVIPTFNDNDVDDYKLENRPHLSYIDNHPLRPLAGMRFTFEVTE